MFALGVTLYHLATGERPFGNPGSPAGLRRRAVSRPGAAARDPCGHPRWLQELILRCLEVDPDARHATAAQLAHDLQHPEQVVLTERAGPSRWSADGDAPLVAERGCASVGRAKRSATISIRRRC